MANVDTSGKVEGEHNNNTICNDSISQNAVSAENIIQDDFIVGDFTSINIDCDFFDAIDATVMPNNVDISHSESGLITNECIASDLPDNKQTVINVESTNLNNACELNNDDFLGRLNVSHVTSREGRPKNRRKELKYVKKTLPFEQEDLSTVATPNLSTKNGCTEQQKVSNVNCRSTADEAIRVEVKKVTDTVYKDDVIFIKETTAVEQGQGPHKLPIRKYSIANNELQSETFFKCLNSNTDWLSSSHMNVAREILRNQFPHIDGSHLIELFASVEECRRVGPPLKKFVEILNVNYAHWICVSNLMNTIPGHVTVYDSVAPSHLSPHWIRCLAWLLFHGGKEIVLDWACVQRQKEGSDCGAFAIAFAVELCWGFNPSGRIFNQQALRQGIVDSLKIVQ